MSLNPSKSSSKCNVCKKKTGLIGFQCNYCSKLFCAGHRLPEEHKCEADFKQSAADDHKKKLINDSLDASHNYIAL